MLGQAAGRCHVHLWVRHHFGCLVMSAVRTSKSQAWPALGRWIEACASKELSLSLRWLLESLWPSHRRAIRCSLLESAAGTCLDGDKAKARSLFNFQSEFTLHLLCSRQGEGGRLLWLRAGSGVASEARGAIGGDSVTSWLVIPPEEVALLSVWGQDKGSPGVKGQKEDLRGAQTAPLCAGQWQWHPLSRNELLDI